MAEPELFFKIILFPLGILFSESLDLECPTRYDNSYESLMYGANNLEYMYDHINGFIKNSSSNRF